MATGRKRIRTMSDSSDDEPPKKPTTSLTVPEKESRLIKAKEKVPGLDSMIIQDALFHANWDVDAAVEHLIATKGTKITQATPAQLAAMAKPIESLKVVSPVKVNLTSPNGEKKASLNDTISPIQRPKKVIFTGSHWPFPNLIQC